MTSTINGIAFDPGFAPYILAFNETVDYLYMDINRFKNFSQKKMKFMQYHKKIVDMFINNLGFYVGCLLWAAYIKTQPKQEILGNHCYGKEYNEQTNIEDTQQMLQFVELFPKDMKYFLGKDFSFDSSVKKLLEVYEEFLVLNKGFTGSKYNTDIVLPSAVKTENAIGYKEIIEEVLETKDLSKLLEYQSLIME